MIFNEAFCVYLANGFFLSSLCKMTQAFIFRAYLFLKILIVAPAGLTRLSVMMKIQVM